MALEKELATYQKELSNLLPQAGKYVLIYQDKVVDVFGTYEDALKAGYRLAGLDAFMVKQIQAFEQVQYITRDIGLPCPS
jgi:hypothetical protein